MSDVKITQEHVDKVLSDTMMDIESFYGKTTIVKAILPNGFVIVESSSCVDPDNYDHELGKEICLKRIKDKIWELEGYRLQCEVTEKFASEE